MYTAKIPYKNFKGEPRTKEVAFHLSEREVFKLLPELQAISEWREVNSKGEMRQIPTEDVREYYTRFEAVLLEAWGEMSDDGEHFRKSGRYDFEDSALFNATMVYFVSDPRETGKLLDGIIPNEGLLEMIKNTEKNTAALSQDSSLTDQQRQEIESLRRQLALAKGESTTD